MRALPELRAEIDATDALAEHIRGVMDRLVARTIERGAETYVRHRDLPKLFGPSALDWPADEIIPRLQRALHAEQQRLRTGTWNASTSRTIAVRQALDAEHRIKRGTPKERFLALCTPDPKSGCWLFNGATKLYGYGMVNWTDYPKIYVAHRLSYTIFSGPIPDGMWVLHRCDTPRCCNPEHLFLGTATDNHKDMCQKQRNAACEHHGRARLTDEQAAAIRADKRPTSVVAVEYRVAQRTIRRIRSGENWKRLGE